MKRKAAFLLGLLASAALPQATFAKDSIKESIVQDQEVEGKELIGRWDIEVDVNGTPAPSWLEVKLSGYKTLVGHYVSTSGVQDLFHRFFMKMENLNLRYHHNGRAER
ncbi:hypothetical protein KUH03_25610 [Sphingobacterium sp. E70]|uniref:hypothetical protein n=1 Tax=Sphingobacterium sp. E70 TaxID=2853439 RepID=UPI00211C19B7|nr:hypothetical protein [Sphingobacterium sp. E70]ULT22697.1 hypothetical protein KUH03_25610 [Sphingobacterium sp. E70]